MSNPLSPLPTLEALQRFHQRLRYSKPPTADNRATVLAWSELDDAAAAGYDISAAKPGQKLCFQGGESFFAEVIIEEVAL